MSTDIITPLRQRMIEDMNARKLCAGTQRGHIRSYRRFAAFLERSPDTATVEDIRRFQLHLAETAVSICTRNRIMTGLRFLLRVTLRRLDLAAEIYHIREPQKIPLVMSADETKRLLAVASSLKARILLSLGYGCGLRAGEVIRLKAKHIDSAQKIIRIEQSKGGKDRNVMLSAETLDLLRQWWKARPSRYDTGTPLQERWLFPGNRREALVTQSAVEALYEAILHQFAGRNVVPFDITLLLPGQDGVRGQLGAVVADDHSGVAPQFGDTIQLTCDPQTGERGVDHQGQAFSGEVIDQREDAEAPSAH